MTVRIQEDAERKTMASLIKGGWLWKQAKANQFTLEFPANREMNREIINFGASS